MAFRLIGALAGERPVDVVRRSTIIALISFFTLIDLFAAQALAPQLQAAYAVDTATMGLALNLAAVGMAIAGLVVAWYSDRIDRRRGIWVSLALLAVPTTLLGLTEDVYVFMALRVVQGACMATAFTLTMTYLSEQCDITAAGGAMAAYITGNVASNLFGRLLASEAAVEIGLSGTFFLFAALNLAGAALAIAIIGTHSEQMPARTGPPLAAWRAHAANPALRAAFAIGFLILFVFVGVFTYVNFELTGPAYALDPATLGLVYFVFLPALITTPMAGGAVSRHGPQRVFIAAGLVSVAGALATLAPALWMVLAGLAVLGMGTFFMQAAATGFVGRAATGNRAAANGLYLTSYYTGGLVGALVLGMAYEAAGWAVTVAAVVLALVLSLALARSLRVADPS